jgi:hypothetical protein
MHGFGIARRIEQISRGVFKVNPGSLLTAFQRLERAGRLDAADTVAEKQFEVARNRYIIGKISNTDLYAAQDQKDQAILQYVQALRTYWTAYYHLRRVTLYDFVARQPLSDTDRK